MLDETRQHHEPHCAIVGGGPGGVVLAYLLARAGTRVTLLESRPDFRRDFRGDSLHPYTLELMQRLGLAERLLRIEHARATTFRFHTTSGTVTTAEYGGLRGPFPYVALMPQARFLDFLAAEAATLPGFRLMLGAKVTGVVDEGDRITGVRYRDDHGEHRLDADLVVGADGRFSRMRRLLDLPARSLGASSDILWFRLPRRHHDPPTADADLYFGPGHYVSTLGQEDGWQVGYTVPKGGYPAAKHAGVGPIRDFLTERVPWLADRVDELTGFDQITLLSVEIARVERWHRPGALLIGDAAHVISPVGGNGILMAIQDAVTAANVLIPALRRGGTPGEDVLAEVRRLREPAVEQVQRQQVRTEHRVAAVLSGDGDFRPNPLLRAVLRLRSVRRRAARANAYGPSPPALDMTLLHPNPDPARGPTRRSR
ncbi:FAD-dependent oxidoreductase [Saccharopolyspora sp. NFXS83]|uniref:FAD-dependent oxidoreductase n=1 Tax=Saccharopolyspora sp. NFXS83 TaxID=2993560 RepID=UPI00224A5F29|nr:FAD-dependent oxidoreductase [Saccharopolyspora sp. NFXS83]MCX2734139.1 FAD-dependent oxidoreductase [Saccharopolyspora sp. NFXS83]